MTGTASAETAIAGSPGSEDKKTQLISDILELRTVLKGINEKVATAKKEHQQAVSENEVLIKNRNEMRRPGTTISLLLACIFHSLIVLTVGANKLSLTVTIRSQSFTALEGAGEELDLPAVESGDQLLFKLDTAGEQPSPDYAMLIVGPQSGSFMMQRKGDHFQLTLDPAILEAGSQQISVYLPPTHMWQVGKINVPRASSEPGELDGPLPPLEHVFRPDPVMPAKWLSFSFTGLVLLPWLPVLFAWYQLGVFSNLKGFGEVGRSPVHLLSTAVFVGSLSVACYLLWLYWVVLSVFQATAALLSCGLVLAVSGRQMLHYFYLSNSLSVE